VEEREVVGCLAETGGPILGSLFVGSGSGWVGRLVTGGSEGITEGTGVGSVEIYCFPVASAVWVGGGCWSWVVPVLVRGRGGEVGRVGGVVGWMG
jgi:hypothetical protein